MRRRLDIHTLQGVSGADRRAWQPRLQLFEQVAGAADRRRPVLYVHGATFPSGCSVFLDFAGGSWANALNAAGFAAWGLDFAGYGRSEDYPEMASAAEPGAGDPPGRAAEAATQIERAVRAIRAKTGAPAVSLIAHSWGTMAAGLFAATHPGLVDRLVLFGPVVQRLTLKTVPALPAWRLVTVDAQKQRFLEDVPAGEPAVLDEADFARWAEIYLRLDPASGSRTPPSVRTPNGPQADIMAAWSGSLAYDPARISAPALIVRGAWDSLCTDDDAAWLRQALVRAAHVADVKIPKATHLMHLERGRTALHAAVNEFLNAKRGSP